MTDVPATLLYEWPAAAHVGSRVPKDRIYARGALTPSVRERFVADVGRIVWAYKLAETTINLPGSPEVPEIQVFRIDAKGDDVPDSVLLAIDKAIPFPIIFEVARMEGEIRRVRLAAAHKPVGPRRAKPSAYFTTSWQRDDAVRVPLPVAISLPTLYASLLDPLMPVTAKPGEEPAAIAARLEAVRKLERELAVLERRLRSERQLNRKIELRRELQRTQAELERQR